MRATIFGLAAAMAATLVLAAPAAADGHRTDEARRVEAAVLEFINDARAHPGQWGIGHFTPAAPLAGWTDLRDAARGWSRAMSATGRVQADPNFRDVCCWEKVGTTVAMSRYLDHRGPERTARRVVEAFLSGSGRDTVMHPRLDEYGVGATVDADGLVWVAVSYRQRDPDRTPPGALYYGSDRVGGGDVGTGRPTPLVREIGGTCQDHQPPPFPDVIGTTHEHAIRCVTSYGIANGRSADSYAPHDPLTRGQAASFLARTLEAAGRPVPAPGEVADAFDDDDGTTHEHAINALVHLGAIQPGGVQIGPNRLLTRADMAAWTHAALEAHVDAPHRGDYYADDEGLSAEYAINRLTDLGVVSGKGDARFAPTELLTRAQMATFLARSLDALLGA